MSLRLRCGVVNGVLAMVTDGVLGQKSARGAGHPDRLRSRREDEFTSALQEITLHELLDKRIQTIFHPNARRRNRPDWRPATLV
jgi:hypothetical protein